MSVYLGTICRPSKHPISTEILTMFPYIITICVVSGCGRAPYALPPPTVRPYLAVSFANPTFATTFEARLIASSNDWSRFAR